MIKYEIQELSWFKRRKLTKLDFDKKREVLNIELEGFKKERYHLCKMHVEYENEKVILTAQVIHNQIKDVWLVNGVDGNGNQVFIKLLED